MCYSFFDSQAPHMDNLTSNMTKAARAHARHMRVGASPSHLFIAPVPLDKQTSRPGQTSGTWHAAAAILHAPCNPFQAIP
jgi:hypothetical protein